ncbi:MAG: hypothetical protein ACRDG6_13150 [Candidatus Limnocylindria bacterium]
MNLLLSGRGGAEVELTSPFADVRGSTPLAEQLGPTAAIQVDDAVGSAIRRPATRSSGGLSLKLAKSWARI